MAAAGAAALIEDLSQWTLHEPVRADVLAAIDLHRREAVLSLGCPYRAEARQLRCRTIWSEDSTPGRYSERYASEIRSRPKISRDEAGPEFLRDPRLLCDLPPVRESSASGLGRQGLHVDHPDGRRAVDRVRGASPPAGPRRRAPDRARLGPPEAPRPVPARRVGVLASVAKPLAEAKISLFALSTFDTDYILVKRIHVNQAIAALHARGAQAGRRLKVSCLSALSAPGARAGPRGLSGGRPPSSSR